MRRPMLLPTYARAWDIKPRRPLLSIPLHGTFTALGRHPEGPDDVGLFGADQVAVQARGGEREGHGLCREAGAKQGEDDGAQPAPVQ
jgi:hypothetical protein